MRDSPARILRGHGLRLILLGVGKGVTKERFLGSLAGLLCTLACQANTTSATAPAAESDPLAAQREVFVAAWNAARRGDRATVERLKQGLDGYILTPYLEYDALLSERRRVEPARIAEFLNDHADWAFAGGLERAWLRTLGKAGRWDALLQYAPGNPDTEVRCYLGQARLQRGGTEGLTSVAQSLWLAGRSQPDACDPLFEWLIAGGGVTSTLAWERIKLAFEARHPQLARYLKRFLEPGEQVWADRWLQQDGERYGRLDRARQWPDSTQGRDLTSYGLRRLARSDEDKAWDHFNKLDGHFAWSPAERAAILHEIALWSAVEGSEATFERMRAVPADLRDGTLLEWWARAGLAARDWREVEAAVEQMPGALRNDDRWRFWQARAAIESGRSEEGQAEMGRLAERPTYYGFLAADFLDRPYAICPREPEVSPEAVLQLRSRPDVQRALELKRAGLDNWSRAEWTLAAGRLDSEGLRAAAALAVEENWADIAILALADSGDFDWYRWRFPLVHHETVLRHTADHGLDSSWVMGLMRSESAMAADAISGAGARGLMQIMPGTAQALSRRHGFNYSGAQQLMQAEFNIQLGTTYLRELLDEYGDNTVLAAGAYNAGPNAVKRWMNGKRPVEAAMWIETLPYRETREYIPRVLAFSAIYDWLLAQPVVRVSSRMPPLDSGNMVAPKTAAVVCPGQADMGAG